MLGYSLSCCWRAYLAYSAQVSIFILINVVVDSESNNTFSNVLDLTEEMVSTAMIVTGVKFEGQSSQACPLLCYCHYLLHIWHTLLLCMLQTQRNYSVFLVCSQQKFVLKRSAFVDLTIVYYGLILIHVVQFQDILYSEYYPQVSTSPEHQISKLDTDF